MNTQTHNYSHFYVLLKDMPFSGDRTELKEMLVSQFTGGRTVSLKKMEYSEYRQMCADMKSAIAGHGQKSEDANVWRKRVIAVIGAYLRNLRKRESIYEIKAIACRATQYDDFNLIPVQRLQNIYYAFLKKNKDFEMVGQVVYEDIELLITLN
jgi:hypothetical protein